MDSAPISSNSNAEHPSASARKVDSASARPTPSLTDKKPARQSQLFAFTVRLTPEQRYHFEALAQAQGHTSVAAAFKAQALSYGMEHPLQEMRLSLEHMQERISEEGTWLQDRIHTVSHAMDDIDRHVSELIGEIQTCTQAMVLFAQTNEALSLAVKQLSNQRPDYRPTLPHSNS
jgi:hypothetical protein